MNFTGLISRVLLLVIALSFVACSKRSSGGSGPAASAETISPVEEKIETKKAAEKSKKNDVVGLEHITLLPGQALLEPVITSSQEAGTFASSLITVSCDFNLPALNSNTNGLILLPGSQVVIFRDQNFRLENGSGTEVSFEPTVVISCEGEATEEVTASASVQVKRLPAKRLMMEVLMTSPKLEPKQSAPVFYTCQSTLDEALNSVYNGFNLLPGSRAVVNRDTKYIFDADSTSSRKPQVVISCE